jgi:uncharacterized protein (DUF4415 family)
MTANPYRGKVPKLIPMSKTRRMYFERSLLNLAALRQEDSWDYAVRENIPEAWDTLEQDVDVVEKKMKITLRLDESVAKFYRAMGFGYQTRINRILATFAQMRIAEVRETERMIEADMERLLAEDG